MEKICLITSKEEIQGMLHQIIDEILRKIPESNKDDPDLRYDNAEFLSIDEAAKILRCSRSTVYNYIKIGLNSFKLGNKRLFTSKDIQSFINNQKLLIQC